MTPKVRPEYPTSTDFFFFFPSFTVTKWQLDDKVAHHKLTQKPQLCRNQQEMFHQKKNLNEGSSALRMKSAVGLDVSDDLNPVRRRSTFVRKLQALSSIGRKPSIHKDNANMAKIKMVRQVIALYRENRDELQRYIERKTDSIAIHLKEKNEAGAVYAMQKLMVAQAEKDHTLKAIGQLNKVVEKLQSGDDADYDYEVEMERIMSAPAELTTDLEETDLVLHEAQKCVRAISFRLDDSEFTHDEAQKYVRQFSVQLELTH